MPNPIFVRPFSPEEHCAIEHGLQSSDAFTLRRCQLLLASARGDTPLVMARELCCGDQTGSNAMHAFKLHGLAALHGGSTATEHLPILVKRSPRTFGKDTGVWTLDLLAAVCFAEGLTPRQVSGETIRATLKRLGIAWKRAKHWIRSPDPAYTPKKSGATG